MSVYEFGRRLLRTNDLDPVYVVVHGAGLDDDPTGENPTLHRWLIAYWCFYHVGTASWAAELPEEEGFWGRMAEAAGSKDFPRSSERRHFRGRAAVESVEYLRGRGTFDLFSELVENGGSTTAAEVTTTVRRWRGFGPWIAFKVADMLERLAIRPVEFDLNTVMYESPRDAADLLHHEEGSPSVPNVGAWAIDRILSTLGPVKAPPRYERVINAQEAETVLCKWKSYLGGHYEVGEDIRAVRNGLMRFSKCPLSLRLLEAGKRGGLWR